MISIVIINAGYFFNKTGIPLVDYKFISKPFQLLAGIDILNRIPVLLPYPFVEGMDWVYHVEKTRGNIYLMGTLQSGGEEYKGFPGYFFVILLFKEPIPILLFAGLVLGDYVRRKKELNLREDDIFLLLPMVYYLIYFNYFYRCQIGIRHILMVLPLVYIFIGGYLKNWERFPIPRRWSVLFLIMFLVVSVLSSFPHYISYVNELMWDRNQAYKVFADSNLDWGQNGRRLEAYLAQHPEAPFNPKHRVSGRVVVEVNRLVGITDDGLPPQTRERYRWLRENFEPMNNIGGAFFFY